MKIEAGIFRVAPLARVLLAVAVLSGVLMLLKVAGFFVASSQVTGAAVRAGGQAADADGLQASLAQARTSAEQLKKKNLFIMPAPKQHPVGEVLGILGDEALIGEKWYKVGDSIGDARIVAIEPTLVKVVWDGQEKEFTPIGAGGSGGPPGPRVERTAPSGRPGRTGGAPVVISGQRRSAPREGFGALSPEERQRWREQFQNMSPEERQRRREEMRQRFEGRGG
jgi:hypothetical protein